MSNLLWYILLTVVGLVTTIYVIYKKRNVYPVSTLLPFYFFSAGISWIGEFTVLGFFNSYTYKTGLFTSPWAQDVLGHKLLNTTFYPAAALIVAAYSLNYFGISIIAAIFTLVEMLYVKLGVYEQHWWRFYMTFIVVFAFLAISKFWFSKMLRKPYGLTRAITFYFTALVFLHFFPPILTLLGKEYYKISLVSNMTGDLYRASSMISFPYHLFVESPLFVLFACVLKKWYWKAMPFVFSAAAQIIFAATNILVIENGWSVIYSILTQSFFIALFILLEKYGLKPNKKISAAY